MAFGAAVTTAAGLAAGAAGVGFATAAVDMIASRSNDSPFLPITAIGVFRAKVLPGCAMIFRRTPP